MTKDEALDKVAKLLRLGQSSNPNEAAAAAARAQDLIDRFELESALAAEDERGEELEGDDAYDEDVEICDHIRFESSKKLPTWKWDLAWAVSSPNACRPWATWTGRTKHVCLIGRPSDVRKCRYLYQYLAAEIDRLAKTEGRGKGRRWSNSFRLGAVATVKGRLLAAQKATRQKLRGEATGGALVKVDRALARIEAKDRSTVAWMEKNGKNYVSTRGSVVTSGGYDAGKRAGRSINLGAGTRAALN